MSLKRFSFALLVLAILGVGLVYLLRTRPAPPSAGPGADEVLRLAAQRSRELQSVSYEIDGNFQVEGGSLPAAGTVRMSGAMNGAGSTIQCTAAVDALVTPGRNRGQTFRVQSSLSAVILGQKELYLKIDALETEPEQSLFQPELVALLLGRWWVFPPPATAGVEAPGGATPSPDVLRAQAQVVRAVEDFGMETLDGLTLRHFSVALDPEKLMVYLQEVAVSRGEAFDSASVAQSLRDFSASGEMWIDARQFTLHRVRWAIARYRMGEGAVSGTFTVALRDFNSAPAISVPTDARPLSPATLFHLGSDQGTSTTLSPGELDALRSLVEGHVSSTP